MVNADRVTNLINRIHETIDKLPGLEKTPEELHSDLLELKAQNEAAGKRLVATRKEAQRWLDFLDDSASAIASVGETG